MVGWSVGTGLGWIVGSAVGWIVGSIVGFCVETVDDSYPVGSTNVLVSNITPELKLGWAVSETSKPVAEVNVSSLPDASATPVPCDKVSLFPAIDATVVPLAIAPSKVLVTTCPSSIFSSTALSVRAVEPEALSNLRLAVKPIDLASLVTIELKSAVGWVPADESLISYATITPVAFCGIGM